MRKNNKNKKKVPFLLFLADRLLNSFLTFLLPAAVLTGDIRFLMGHMTGSDWKLYWWDWISPILTLLGLLLFCLAVYLKAYEVGKGAEENLFFKELWRVKKSK